MGIFENWVRVLSFCEIFLKSLIRLSPICYDYSCVGPMWHFEHVLRHFSLCSCIFHHLCTLLHVRCLTECPSDIFVLNWIQVNSNFWDYTCLTLFNLFWSLIMCITLCPCWCAYVAALKYRDDGSCSRFMTLAIPIDSVQGN